MADADEVDRLRAELDEWRRRAEVAEAVAVERLARAETAERALRAAEVALASRGPSGPQSGVAGPSGPQSGVAGPQAAAQAGQPPTGTPPPAAERRPASLLERWRRYTETIN